MANIYSNISLASFVYICIYLFFSYSTQKGTRRAESGSMTPSGYSVTGSWEVPGY
jgi:hypothetical protein